MADRWVFLVGMAGLAACIVALGVTFYLQDYTTYPVSVMGGPASPFEVIVVAGVAFAIVAILGALWPKSWRSVIPDASLGERFRLLFIVLGALFLLVAVASAYLAETGTYTSQATMIETAGLGILGALVLVMGAASS